MIKGHRREIWMSFGIVQPLATSFLFFNFLELALISIDLINEYIFFSVLKVDYMKIISYVCQDKYRGIYNAALFVIVKN